jgi:hypothetical protein
MPRRVIIISTLVVLALLSASLWWWNANPERRFQFLKNEAASCANCRKQLAMSLLMYSSSYDGWFPRGKASALESLSLLTQHDPQFTVHVLTSHDKQAELMRQWSDPKRLPEDLICYRYNAGLRQGDPAQLIVLYYYTPTRWECSLHKGRQIGRPVMFVDSSWTFLPEEEYARQQRRTEEFIRERGDAVAGKEDGIISRSTRTAARRVGSDIPREHEQ